MTPLERMLIVQACEQLCIEYARAIDFRDYDNFINLFAEDAHLDAHGSLTALTGQAAIGKAITSRADEFRSRHVITNLFVDVIDDCNAHGIAYLTLYEFHGDASHSLPVPLDQPACVGHFQDTYIRNSGVWLFKNRKLHPAFRTASHLHI